MPSSSSRRDALQTAIEARRDELAALRDQLPDADGARPFRSLRDELPPHY